MNIFNIDYDAIINAITGRSRQPVKAKPKPTRTRKVETNGLVAVVKERTETRKINPKYQPIVNNRGFVQFQFCVACPKCKAKAMQPCTGNGICMERALEFAREAQRDWDWYKNLSKEAYI